MKQNGETKNRLVGKTHDDKTDGLNVASRREYDLVASGKEQTEKDYISPFSFLVVTRILHETIVKKIIWFIILVLLCIFSIYLVVICIEEYQKEESYFENKIISTNKNYFPSVTFCIERRTKYLHCGYELDEQYPYGVDPNKACDHIKDKFQPREFIDRRSTYALWTNGEFEISCIKSKKCNPNDIDKKYIKTTNSIRGKCVTWNYNGNYSNLDNEIELSVFVRDPEFQYKFQNIEAIIHNHDVIGTDQKTTFKVGTGKSYDIGITKRVINRISTNSMKCLKGKRNDIFPKRYTVEQCFDSLHCMSVYQKCGDTYDFCRDYIPFLIQMKYQQNRTIKEMVRCFKSFNKTIDLAKCQLPCHEKKYDLIISDYESNAQAKQFSMVIKHQEPHIYVTETEKLIFNTPQLLGCLAGIFTFFLGGPILFFVELPIFILSKIFQKKK